MLSPDNIHTILEIIDKQLLLFVGKTIGEDGLSESDKQILVNNRIDYKNLYDETTDLVKLNFQLGMLSSILSSKEAQGLNQEQLIRYIKSGQHIPLNQRELATINNIKMQSLADIKSTRGKIFQDINNVVADTHGNARANQEEYLRNKIIQGLEKREDRKTIARKIAKEVGDWSRNFDKSVSYISHTALNEGRVAMLERRYSKGDEEGKAYFLVQKTACKYCVEAYLTNGEGSEPKIFTVSELQNNGSNIGRKASEYKPTIAALHVNCRCTIQEYILGTVWNGNKFVWPKGESYKSTLNRPKITIKFNNKEYLV